MKPIDRVLERLDAVSESGGQHTAHCPAHEDRQASLSVAEGRDGRVLINCHAGCTAEQVASAIGLKMSDLYPQQLEPKANQASRRRKQLTVDELAEDKGLPARFLREQGVTERGRDVQISYLLEDNQPALRQRKRSDVSAKKGSTWYPGKGEPVPYGLWHLSEARQRGFLVIVEGESDCWTLWYMGFPALGLPGADMTGKLQAAHVEGIARLYVVREPDGGGNAFIEGMRGRLNAIAYRGTAYAVRMEKWAKDPNALFKADPAAFSSKFQAMIDEALPIRRLLPSIEIKGRQGREIVDEAMQALVDYNEPPTLFIRGTAPVHVVQDDKGRPVIESVTEAVLDDRLNRAANFFRTTKRQTGIDSEPADISQRYVRRLLVHPRIPFPPLESIVRVPVLRPDGSILRTPGYDEATRLYYYPDPELSVPDVPEHPTPEETSKALKTLLLPIQDFPFTCEASKANALAMILTPIIRPLLHDANVPMAGINAPVQGTGKTLLADVASLIATGEKAATMSAPGTEDEWRKQITAQLLKGLSFIVVDNIKGRLSSSALEQCLTTAMWRDRVLGYSMQVDVPQRATWIATGNNLTPYGDMIRRMYMIRLDAKTSRPWRVGEYQIKNLGAWTKQHRGELVWAILVLARAWIAAGHPKPSVRPIGSFETWTVTAGGILKHAGMQGFLGNLEEMYDDADEEGAEWVEFLEALHKQYGMDSFTAKDLAALIEQEHRRDDSLPRDEIVQQLIRALPDPAPDMLARRRPISRTLGMMFHWRKDRRFGEKQWRIEAAGDQKNTKVWKVTLGGGTNDGKGGTISRDSPTAETDRENANSDQNQRFPSLPSPDGGTSGTISNRSACDDSCNTDNQKDVYSNRPEVVPLVPPHGTKTRQNGANSPVLEGGTNSELVPPCGDGYAIDWIQAGRRIETPKGSGEIVEPPEPPTWRVPVRLDDSGEVRYFPAHELQPF